MTKKRVLAALLALCLLVGMLPLSAGATDDKEAKQEIIVTTASVGDTPFNITKTYDGTDKLPDNSPLPSIGLRVNYDGPPPLNAVLQGDEVEENTEIVYTVTEGKFAQVDVGERIDLLYTVTIVGGPKKDSYYFIGEDGKQTNTTQLVYESVGTIEPCSFTISFEKPTQEIYVGDNFSLKVSNSINNTDFSYNFSDDQSDKPENERVIFFRADGTGTGLRPGKAIITANLAMVGDINYTNYQPPVPTTCTINVKKKTGNLNLDAHISNTLEDGTKTLTLIVGKPERAGGTVTVACKDNLLVLSPQDNIDNQWTATIPADVEDGTEYTFTASYEGEDYDLTPASKTIKVEKSGTPEPPEHIWSTSWSNDENYHWHACIGSDLCNEKQPGSNAAHTWGEDGSCAVCGYRRVTPPTTPSTPSTPSTPTPKDEVTTTPTVSGGTASTTVSSSDGASLVEAAKQPSTGEVTVKVDTTQDVTAANVTLPVSTVTGVGAANTDLKIETPVADITLPSETLTGLGSGASSVTVSAAVNEDKTVSIDVKKDNTTVTALAQPMKAAIPAPDITGTTVAVLVNEDGTETVIPKSISGKDEISLLLGGSAKIKLKDNSKAFNDTKGHWADKEGAVGFVSSRELFKGTTDTSFSPNATMTRGMMVTVLHRLESKPKGGSVSFGDVSADAYFAEAVAWGNENDIVKGDGSKFLPNDNVTREQLATFLYRYAGKYGVDTTGRTNLTSFPDSGNVSGYAKDALEWAYHTGLIKGTDNGRLDPAGSAKRGEVAAILMRFVEYINK